MGLYPSTSLHSLLSQPTSGAFNNDTEHDFDVFVRWENPPDSIFDDLIANLKTYSSAPNYDLDDFNCSTWAVKELEKIGYIFPQTIVNFGGGAGYGLCPAQLGQDLRANQPPNTYMNPAGGSGPSTTCQ
ncbi:MAG: hypothetical protein Q7T20_06650 [Saprospiraceae bacterium]|nr:hypothetical protein [Saprospiraceae bacterium]